MRVSCASVKQRRNCQPDQLTNSTGANHALADTTGAADRIPAGMCCSLDDDAPPKSAEKCCGIVAESQCDSRENCIWYQILPENEKHYKLIIEAYPHKKQAEDPGNKAKEDPTNKKPPRKYRLACKSEYAGQKIRIEPKPGAW